MVWVSRTSGSVGEFVELFSIVTGKTIKAGNPMVAGLDCREPHCFIATGAEQSDHSTQSLSLLISKVRSDKRHRVTELPSHH